MALGHARRDEEALFCFIRAIELYPAFFSAWYHRGVALTALGRLDKAIFVYEEARKLNPSDASTIFNLACVYGVNDKMDKMKECLLAAEKAGHPRAREMLRDM